MKKTNRTIYSIKNSTSKIFLFLIGVSILFSWMLYSYKPKQVVIQKVPVIRIEREVIVLSEWENTILNLTNAARKEQELPALIINQKLTEAARAQAADMVAKGYFAHETPDGKKFNEWIVGYAYRYAGNNLARDYKTAEEVVAGWLNSEGHRKNIMDARYTDIGVGVVGGFSVQMFGQLK